MRTSLTIYCCGVLVMRMVKQNPLFTVGVSEMIDPMERVTVVVSEQYLCDIIATCTQRAERSAINRGGAITVLIFRRKQGTWMSMNQWKRSMKTPVISSRYPCLFPCPIVGVCFHWVASTQCQQNLEFTGPNKSRVRYSRTSRFSHSAGRFQWSLAWRASLTEMFPGMSDFWLNSGLVQNSYMYRQVKLKCWLPKGFSGSHIPIQIYIDVCLFLFLSNWFLFLNNVAKIFCLTVQCCTII